MMTAISKYDETKAIFNITILFLKIRDCLGLNYEMQFIKKNIKLILEIIIL